MPDTTREIKPVSPDSKEAILLVQELDRDLQQRYPGVELHPLAAEDPRSPRFVFLVAYSNGEAVGCGAVRELESDVGEVKRMFVRPRWRRRGVARQILAALESEGRRRGYAALRLETGSGQPEAIALYRSAGYVEIAPFGEYVGNPVSVCFEKTIGAPSRPG
jgi:GNAT superfamily N-acetyltransferase